MELNYSKKSRIDNQSGFAQIVVLGALLVGLAIAVYLVQTKQILRSRADETSPVTLVGAEKNQTDGSYTTYSNTYHIKVTVPKY